MVMMLPLFDDISSAGAIVAALAIGVAFGWFLERGGLGNARKLTAQFFLRDFTVFKVLFTALVTAMLGAFWLARFGVLDLSRVYLPETFWVAQLIGGIIFGIGFVIGGLCPGTSCVAAASGKVDGLLVIAGMLGGVLVFHEAYDVLRPVYDAGALGPATLPAAFRLSHAMTALLVTVVALAGFAVAQWIERRSV
jgi:uncharacterized membrane protein YedE/YeeE